VSNYRAEALNPKTSRVENADWLDNHFGHRVYGVKFDDGEVYHAWDVGLLAAGKRLEKAEWVLQSSGFRRCDIPACNCNSWHQVGGYAERFREIREAVEDAGYSTNGKILLQVIKEILAAAPPLASEHRGTE
jgi:hypothetical protein